MAVDNVGVIEGWRRLLQMMKAQKGSYAGYVGMKIVMAIGASVVLECVGCCRSNCDRSVRILGVVVVLLGHSGGLIGIQ